MNDLTNPALLGCILICVALSAWALGRWQSTAAPTRQPLAAPPLSFTAPAAVRSPAALDMARAQPCQPQAQVERQSVNALGQTVSLCDLHAEVSAYRRQERILATLTDDAFRVERSWPAARPDCRYMGLTGQPTCAVPAAAMEACGCGQVPLNLWEITAPAEAAHQPSLDFVPFTRV